MVRNFHQHFEDCRTATIWDAWQLQGRLSEAPRCRYRGCNRDCYQKASGMYYEFCGTMHADAHIAEAFDYDMLEEPGLCGPNKCGLPGCNRQRAVDSAIRRVHDFCTKSHMLQYTTLKTNENLKAGKLCQIEKCFRPVYVEINGRSHSYCSLKHSRLAAAAEGAGLNVLRNRQPEGSGEEISSRFNQDQDSRNRRISPVKQEGETYRLNDRDHFGHSGFDGGINDQQMKNFLIASQTKLLEELAQGTQSDSSPNTIDIFQGADGARFRHINIYQGADISKFHPWEVVTEPKPRYLLSITSKNKVTRQTRDGWCWKQTGPSYRRKHSGLSSKYLSYKRTKGCVDSSRKKKDSWNLHEFSLKDEDIEDIIALAGQKGLEKSDRFRKAVVLKMFQADHSGPGRGEEDHPTSNLDSATLLHEPSEGEVSDPNGQCPSPPALDTFCGDLCYDVQLPEQHELMSSPWYNLHPDASWIDGLMARGACGDYHHL